MTVNRRNGPQILALAMTLAGCEFIGPQLHQKMPLPEPSLVDEQQPLDSGVPVVQNTAKVELFPSEEAASINPGFSVTTEKKSGGKGEFSLNFDDADLGEVAKVILSDILGRNYTISPQVTGKVTLQTTDPLTKDELIPTLELLLSVNNAALVSQGDMYLIKPSNEAVYSTSIKSFGNSRIPAGYQTRIIPVRNVAASEIAEILKPLLPEKSLLHVDPNRNLLLVSGSGSEMTRILDVVNTFDVDVLRGRSFALFTPAHVDASKIIEELEEIFARKQGGEGKDGGNEFFRFIEIERLNAILAITQNEKYLRDIENWVLRLDRTNADAGGGVNVYRAQHVSAVDLAETLNNIFGGGSSRGSSSASIASGRKSLSAGNKASGSDNSNESNGVSGSGGMSGSNSGSSNSSMSGKKLKDRSQDKKRGGDIASSSSSGGNSEMPNVRIIADEGNNALIIVSSSEEYAKIQNVLKQLDVLPMQVIIDATIVEVNLNDDLQYGIQWYLSHENGGTNIAQGGANNSLVSSVKDSQGNETGGVSLRDVAAAVGTGGFSYAFASRSGDINAILKAGAANNNINVISSPSLMVLNNQEATIKVGDSVPIRSSVSSNLSSLNSNNGNNGIVQTSSIQMVDTGVILSVRPRVNAGGLVSMEILQSVNQATETKTSQNIDSPTIQKREIETSIAVQSGETLVLGGLIKENNVYNRSGVPLLHEIPLIGPIFGSTTRNKDKSELVVLITPRVVNSRQDAQSITDEFRRKLSSIYEVPVETLDQGLERDEQ